MNSRFTLCLLVGSLAGCATYQAKPLDLRPSLPHDVPRLVIDAAQMPLPELAAHKFDPSDGLDMTEVAMLAVANNPDLKLARDDLGIARAQAFAAGLLPDPQISLIRDFPSNGGPGATSAFNLGLNYDINALLLRSSAKAAAQAESRKTDLALLWQEWQVVGQARLLFVRTLEQQKLMSILQESHAVAAMRYQRARQALELGNLTLQAASAEANALQGIDKQINDLERQITQNGHALNALLGLAPDVKLRLVGGAELSELDQVAIVARLPQLAQRRPDLMALRAGYQAQEQRFRKAILAQFPALSIGITRARDTGGLYTQGFGISLNLPIFNRNQGNIAIEKATRQRMNDEFKVRLNTAYSEIARLLADQALLEKQLVRLRQSLDDLEQVAARAEQAFRAGNMDLLSYASLRAAVLGKKVEQISLEQSILEQRVALQTLMGGELPEKNLTRGNK